MRDIKISDYDYNLSEERIAKYPLERRDFSKLLVWEDNAIRDERFFDIGDILPDGALLIFNNTKVVRARMIFFKESGARIEIFCLEPQTPSDYERAFACKGRCRWNTIIGNLKKWKEGALKTVFEYNGVEDTIRAERIDGNVVEFSWNSDATFGQILEILGRMPIPPYLNRENSDIDNTRYQTVYSKLEGSVAAPTAGLHFTDEIIASLEDKNISCAEVTLHVGAGTFLPVKSENAALHTMHTEHFEVKLVVLKTLLERIDCVIAVGTTSVRTLESIAVLGYRVMVGGTADESHAVSQWEAYDIPAEVSGKELIGALISYMESGGVESLKSATQIMITPDGFTFRVVKALVTNFHQPKSTLLLLISAVVGDNWKKIYRHAMDNDYRFLSYGDSSLLTTCSCFSLRKPKH